MELHILELAVISLMIRRRLRVSREVSPCLRAPDGMQALRSRRRRRAHYIQLPARPVRRHLPPATSWIIRRTHRLQQLLLDGISQRQADRPIPIVRKEPVIPRPHRHARRHQQRLVPRTRNLEEDLLLPLQHNLAIVCPTRQIHQPVKPHQFVASQRGLRDRLNRLPTLIYTCSRLTGHAPILSNSNRHHRTRLYREAITIDAPTAPLFRLSLHSPQLNYCRKTTSKTCPTNNQRRHHANTSAY